MISAPFQLRTRDNVVLEAIRWKSEENPKAIIALVHGYGEHQVRYAHVCKSLILQNWHVYSYDQRGHGKSPGKRGHFSDYNTILDDLEALLKTIGG